MKINKNRLLPAAIVLIAVLLLLFIFTRISSNKQQETVAEKPLIEKIPEPVKTEKEPASQSSSSENEPVNPFKGLHAISRPEGIQTETPEEAREEVQAEGPEEMPEGAREEAQVFGPEEMPEGTLSETADPAPEPEPSIEESEGDITIYIPEGMESAGE